MNMETRATELCLRDVQHVLRRRIFDSNNMFPSHLVKQKEELVGVVRRAVKFAESASVLVLGPRGSGKSLIVKKALDELKSDSETADCFINIYLNGAVQTRDVLALKEIAIQLSLVSELEACYVNSFRDAFSFLLETLRSGSKESKAIIFVLDEFDRFAQDRSQKLLYSLLEQTQSVNVPVAVVGITCRLDVIELLEKRVKSRFSHQQISLFDGFSFQDYTQMFNNLLELTDEFPHSEFASQWNNSVKKLQENPEVIRILQNQYDLSRDLRSLQRLLAIPCGKVTVGHPFIEASDLQESAGITTLDTRILDINGLSVLELCLLIAMAHLTEKLDGEPFNGEMIYQEYRKFASRSQSIDFLTKPVAMQSCFNSFCLHYSTGITKTDGSRTGSIS
ncbi:origin recognition complex subunit 4-like isoform X2 [Corticium candelabrum]|uniref:origin recognition complex subunit 4-like isoform X2 n=1 Tax=Corticium candelabrum TaxID=121492 RepID=UPI002E27345E|nr:origin recognition complex subunit 4-like isoform X2 [Corticium candelabrum]